MTGKATEKDPALKVARHRRSGVEVAKGIGDVPELALDMGYPAPQFLGSTNPEDKH
jgi:hypothetical protein